MGGAKRMTTVQPMIRRARSMSKRTRLLIALATGIAALTTLVGVASAYEDIVYFVGDNACHENVLAGSDQIVAGYSYDHYVVAVAFIGQCNDIFTSGAYLRAYGNQTNGTWKCSATGYDDVSATCSSPLPYVRAHCVNLAASSSRWMTCYKIRRF
jgi:hypothetical protein